MTFRLDGRVALITGVRSGIGGEIARSLAAAGAEVILANRTTESAEAIASELRQTGAKAHVLPFAATPEACEALVSNALALTSQRLDILCHAAGGCAWTALSELSTSVLRDTLAINLESCFWLTQAALPALKRSQNGRVIVISSITGPRVAMSGSVHYAAAKAGVNGFIRGAALELAPDGITVNGVEPGVVAKDRGRLSREDTLERITRYVPLGRAGRPEDISSAVHFLASAEASWITGQTIVVDGGTVLPESGFAMEETWDSLDRKQASGK